MNKTSAKLLSGFIRAGTLLCLTLMLLHPVKKEPSNKLDPDPDPHAVDHPVDQLPIQVIVDRSQSMQQEDMFDHQGNPISRTAYLNQYYLAPLNHSRDQLSIQYAPLNDVFNLKTLPPTEFQPNYHSPIHTALEQFEMRSVQSNRQNTVWILSDGAATDMPRATHNSPVHFAFIAPRPKSFTSIEVIPESLSPDFKQGVSFSVTLSRLPVHENLETKHIESGTLRARILNHELMSWPIKWTNQQSNLQMTFNLPGEKLSGWQQHLAPAIEHLNCPIEFEFLAHQSTERSGLNPLKQTIIFYPYQFQPRILLLEGQPNLDTRHITQILNRAAARQDIFLDTLFHLGLGRITFKSTSERPSIADPATYLRRFLPTFDLVVTGRNLEHFGQRTQAYLSSYINQGGQCLDLSGEMTPEFNSNSFGQWRSLDQPITVTLQDGDKTISPPLGYFDLDLKALNPNKSSALIRSTTNLPLIFNTKLGQGARHSFLLKDYGRSINRKDDLDAFMLALPGILTGKKTHKSSWHIDLHHLTDVASSNLAFTVSLNQKKRTSLPDKLTLEIRQNGVNMASVTAHRIQSTHNHLAQWHGRVNLPKPGLYQISLTSPIHQTAQNASSEVYPSSPVSAFFELPVSLDEMRPDNDALKLFDLANATGGQFVYQPQTFLQSVSKVLAENSRVHQQQKINGQGDTQQHHSPHASRPRIIYALGVLICLMFDLLKKRD